MKQKDIEFLVQLQKDLVADRANEKTQADPIFYGVMDEQSIWGLADGEPALVLNGNDVISDFQEAKDTLYAYVEEHLTAAVSELEDWDDMRKFVADNFNSSEFVVSYFQVREEIMTITGAFLTRKDADEHIADNSYFYNNPRSYAMTGWRNPRYERLIEILRTTDWEKVFNRGKK